MVTPIDPVQESILEKVTSNPMIPPVLEIRGLESQTELP